MYWVIFLCHLLTQRRDEEITFLRRDFTEALLEYFRTWLKLEERGNRQCGCEMSSVTKVFSCNILNWAMKENAMLELLFTSIPPFISPYLAFLRCLLVALTFKASLIPSTLCSWEGLHFENTWHSGKYTLYVKNQWWHNIYSPKAKHLEFLYRE